MSIERFGPLLIQATHSAPIADDEWAAYIALTSKVLQVKGQVQVAIQYALTHGPSAPQRALIAKVVQDDPFARFSLISASSLVRGAVTAMSWLVRKNQTEMRAFAPGKEREALVWLAEAGPFDIDAAYQLLSAHAVAVGYSPLP